MATAPEPTLIDAHVHIHAAADTAAVLDAACDNFTRAAATLGHSQWSGVLMLAEMREAAWFETAAAAGTSSAGGWTLQLDPEDDLVLRASGQGKQLLIVAGRQVATREGVEVLTLGTRARLPDNMALQQTLEQAAGQDALIVLPWGAGKWTGERRKLVQQALLRQAPPVSAADSGGRPAFWSAKKDFAAMLGQRRALVSGSDPLPLPGEARRVGSFGCWLAEKPPAVRPGIWLRERLRAASTTQLRPFGRPLALLQFFSKQVGLRMSRRRGADSAAHARGISGEKPDVETSSAGYASRFAGAAGKYLLQTQSQAIEQVLRGLPPGRALDVGGGHGQLVPLLRRLGWQVTVHGTDAQCAHNLRDIHGLSDCDFMQGGLFQLPAADRSFDLVIAVRLVSHVEQWPRLLAEMCRVASRAVVIDYPIRGGMNSTSGSLFGLKKAVERNTRTYLSFSHAQLQQALAAQGFDSPRRVSQFVLPMVAHRLGKGSAPLRFVESLCRATGITALVGSPVILRMDRQ